LKILYDHLGFMEKYGGVSRYYSQMIAHLPATISYDIAIHFSSNEYLPLIKKNGYFHFINKNFPHKDRFYSELNKPNSIRHIKHGDYDVYHMTHCDPYGFKFVPENKMKVMTVHDLNLYMIPGIVSDTFSLKVWQKESAGIVDKIIAVSENTKKDMIEQWNIPEQKITVIHHGVSIPDKADFDIPTQIEKPYILYVGSRAAFKNFNMLVSVFEKLCQRYPDLLLVCTGSSFSAEEQKMISGKRLTDKIKQISVGDRQLHSLYHHACCYVYPSLYEGFGMPLLEAMAAECPVVCSQSSCFPEIAGDAALYFDPHSEQEMLYAIEKMISSNAMRETFISLGNERIKKFTWEECAAHHAQFYFGCNCK